MGGHIFFKDWALWQQMTFVLAMCIISVFCLGCCKLWYNNRLMRRREVLDEEKRARHAEMRRAGVPVSSKRSGSDIPFGVRAIQGGVEVNGIWISRPVTPSVETKGPRVQSTATLVGTTEPAEPGKKGKHQQQMDDSRSPTEQRGSQSDTSIIQRLTDVESLASTGTRSGTPRQKRFATNNTTTGNTKAKQYYRSAVNTLNEDTLRRLDNYSPDTRTTYETYVPSERSPRRSSQRSSASSSGDSTTDSQPMSGLSVRSGSGRSYASSRSSRGMYGKPSSRPTTSRSKGFTSAPRDEDGRDHHIYEASRSATPISPITYVETGSGSGSGHHSPTVSSSPVSGRGQDSLQRPKPTLSPGELRADKTSRMANSLSDVPAAATHIGTDRETAGVGKPGTVIEGGLHPRPQNGRREALSYTQMLRVENASTNF